MHRVDLLEDLSISRMVYGTMRLVEAGDARAVRTMVDHCLDLGITTFDLADIYGGYTCEKVFGAALAQAPLPRDQIEIISKCDIVAPVGRHAGASVKHYDTRRAHIEGSVEQALRDLGTDYLDLLLLHRPDPLMNAEETGRVLDDLVSAGKVRAVGVSNFLPHDVDLLQSRMDESLVVNQIEVSLSHTAPLTDGQLAYAQTHRMVPMAWSPLGGGALLAGGTPLGQALAREVSEFGDWSLAALALSWLMTHPAGLVPVLGSNSRERVTEMSKAAGMTLDHETWYRLYAASLGHDVP